VERKQLVRDVKRAALTRLEDAARTVEDFQTVIKTWDGLDENRERKERFHEVGRDETILELNYTDGIVLPAPIIHPAWREAMNGEFIEMIYDNAEEMWQLVEDWDVSIELENLSVKQKDVVFLSAVRLCTPQQIACFQDKTDRAVRKLLAVALEKIRDYLAGVIRWQIQTGDPNMTLAKRQFLERYEHLNCDLDVKKSVLDKTKHE